MNKIFESGNISSIIGLILLFLMVSGAIISAIKDVINSNEKKKREEEHNLYQAAFWKKQVEEWLKNTESKFRKYKGYPEDWGMRMYFVASRDDNTCQECGIKNKFSKFHVHHNIPLSKGGDNSLDNLVYICLKCHQKHHPYMNSRNGIWRNNSKSSFIKTDRIIKNVTHIQEVNEEENKYKEDFECKFCNRGNFEHLCTKCNSDIDKETCWQYEGFCKECFEIIQDGM